MAVLHPRGGQPGAGPGILLEGVLGVLVLQGAPSLIAFFFAVFDEHIRPAHRC